MQQAEQAAAEAAEAEAARAEATEPGAASATPPDRPARSFGVRIPDVRADVAAMPGILRTSRLIYLPLALILVGFVTAALTVPPAKNTQGTSVQSIESIIIQLTIAGPSLIYFVAGFIAPRAAYLLGAALGLIDGVLLAVLYVSGIGWFAGSTTPSDAASIVVTSIAIQVVTGAVFAWFASWYRDFLKRSQARSKEQAEARRKEQRRQTRRTEARPRAR